MLGCRGAAVAALLAGSTTLAISGGPDPRTAQGQLAACGGLWNWQRIGYIEFAVVVRDASGLAGRWHYHWDRTNSFLRLTGDGPDGVPVDVVIEVRSRTGGGWEGGELVVGEPLEALIGWALARWDQDLTWLAFPLLWSAPGVTVRPGEGAGSAAAPRARSTRVETPSGTWEVLLDDQTGRVALAVRDFGSPHQRTVEWLDWEEHGGMSFARRRAIAETGEAVEVEILSVRTEAPPGVY